MSDGKIDVRKNNGINYNFVVYINEVTNELNVKGETNNGTV